MHRPAYKIIHINVPQAKLLHTSAIWQHISQDRRKITERQSLIDLSVELLDYF